MKYIPHIMISIIAVSLVIASVTIYGSMTYLQSTAVLKHAEWLAGNNYMTVMGNEDTENLLKSICRANKTYEDSSREKFLNYNKYGFSFSDCDKERMLDLENSYNTDIEYYILKGLSLYHTGYEITGSYHSSLIDRYSKEGLYFIDRTPDVIASGYLQNILGYSGNFVSQFISRCEIHASEKITLPMNFTLDVNCTRIVIESLKNETPYIEDEIDFSDFAERCIEPGFIENNYFLKNIPGSETDIEYLFKQVDRGILCNRLEEIFMNMYNRMNANSESDLTISRFFKAFFFAHLSSDIQYRHYEYKFLDNYGPLFDDYFIKNYPELIEED